MIIINDEATVQRIETRPEWRMPPSRHAKKSRGCWKNPGVEPARLHRPGSAGPTAHEIPGGR